MRTVNFKFGTILLIFRPNGKIIFVRPEETVEARTVKEGAIITVKHSGINVHGTLLYPKFYRERLDVKWSDLVNKPL